MSSEHKLSRSGWWRWTCLRCRVRLGTSSSRCPFRAPGRTSVTPRCRETRPSLITAWREWKTSLDRWTTSNRTLSAWSSPWAPRTILPGPATTCTSASLTIQMVRKWKSVISTLYLFHLNLPLTRPRFKSSRERLSGQECGWHVPLNHLQLPPAHQPPLPPLRSLGSSPADVFPEVDAVVRWEKKKFLTAFMKKWRPYLHVILFKAISINQGGGREGQSSQTNQRQDSCWGKHWAVFCNMISAQTRRKILLTLVPPQSRDSNWPAVKWKQQQEDGNLVETCVSAWR